MLEGRTNNWAPATFPFQTQFNHQNGKHRHFGHKREREFITYNRKQSYTKRLNSIIRMGHVGIKETRTSGTLVIRTGWYHAPCKYHFENHKELFPVQLLGSGRAVLSCYQPNKAKCNQPGVHTKYKQCKYNTWLEKANSFCQLRLCTLWIKQLDSLKVVLCYSKTCAGKLLPSNASLM